jgi:cation:H+ antiporter
MVLPIIALVLGFVGLIFSADKFSEEGAKLGKILQVSPIVIGLLVFGFGTSAPEILVSAFAAIGNNNGIALGNALGSNIFNILLVLAISAIISVVPFSQTNLKKEYLVLVIITIILGVLLFDNYLSRIDGLILLTLFIVFLYLVMKTAKNELLSEAEVEINESKPKIYLMLILSLIILLISAKLVVYGGENIARFLGISELIIGLTIISLGTSLPELALAIASSLKKQHEMLIGNVLGSNIFNSTAVLSVVALINPSATAPEVFSRDYIFVIIATTLIFAFSFKLHKKHSINRISGFLLLLTLAVYINTLI